MLCGTCFVNLHLHLNLKFAWSCTAEDAATESIRLQAQLLDLQASRQQLQIDNQRLNSERLAEHEAQLALETRWRLQRAEWERALAEKDAEKQAQSDCLVTVESQWRQVRSELEALVAEKDAEVAAALQLRASHESMWLQQRADLERAVEEARAEARTEIERLQRSHAQLLFELAAGSTTPAESEAAAAAAVAANKGHESDIDTANELLLAQQREDLAALAVESAKRDAERVEGELRQVRDELFALQHQHQQLQVANQLLQQQGAQFQAQMQQMRYDLAGHDEQHQAQLQQYQQQIADLQHRLQQQQAQSDADLEATGIESNSLRAEIAVLQQRLRDSADQARQAARSHEQQMRALNETRTALVSQTELCQSLAHEVQQQRDKVARLMLDVQRNDDQQATAPAQMQMLQGLNISAFLVQALF